VYKNLLIVLFLFILSCNHGTVLQGFDSQRWQEDADGCKSQRLELADDIITRKAEIEGLGQNEITAIFGKPNRHELYSRNKKAFVYYIDGGPDCEIQKENPGKLVIRFDGIGRAKEIILYKN
jgi:hypothetical protein